VSCTGSRVGDSFRREKWENAIPRPQPISAGWLGRKGSCWEAGGTKHGVGGKCKNSFALKDESAGRGPSSRSQPKSLEGGSGGKRGYRGTWGEKECQKRAHDSQTPHKRAHWEERKKGIQHNNQLAVESKTNHSKERRRGKSG